MNHLLIPCNGYLDFVSTHAKQTFITHDKYILSKHIQARYPFYINLLIEAFTRRIKYRITKCYTVNDKHRAPYKYFDFGDF